MISNVVDPMSHVKAVTRSVLVTPELAAKWLESNKNNRRIQPERVKLYALVMQRGGWHFTHQGIAFFADGRLADGQHRLLAITQSKASVLMNVTHGLEVPAATVVDTGRPRNAANAMQFLGRDTKNKFVPAARALYDEYLRQRGIPSARGRVVDNEVFLEFCEAARDSIEFATRKAATRGLSNSVVRASIASAWFTRDRDRLEDFQDQLHSGIVSSEGDFAVCRLRDWLQTSTLLTSGGGAARLEVRRRTCTALLAYLEYKSISRLSNRGEATFPIPDLI